MQSGGIFMGSGGPRGTYICDSVLMNVSKSDNSSQDDYKTRNISNGEQKKRDKNLNINTSTPTKRKLVEEKTVQNLIGFYDRANSSIQVGGGESESPAKRRLLCRRSGGQ